MQMKNLDINPSRTMFSIMNLKVTKYYRLDGVRHT